MPDMRRAGQRKGQIHTSIFGGDGWIQWKAKQIKVNESVRDEKMKGNWNNEPLG